MGKKKIDIYGDSISTHFRFQKEGYKVYYDKQTAEENYIYSYRDCWWWPVSERLAMKYGSIAKIENHSYSGSFVSGSEFPAGASDQRIRGIINPYYESAFILIYMGLNDFGYRVHLDDFYRSYCAMLQKMKELFPEAQILPATLLMTESVMHPQWRFPQEERFEEYNEKIRDASAACGCTLMDLAKSGVRLPTIDRNHSHPTREGHRRLKECWIDQLKEADILEK